MHDIIIGTAFYVTGILFFLWGYVVGKDMGRRQASEPTPGEVLNRKLAEDFEREQERRRRATSRP